MTDEELSSPNWQEEAMRQNALLHQALSRADRLEAALKCLIEHCEITRDTAGYWKSQTTHQINPTQWKSWCKQIKFARASMEGEQQ